jgi:hypothetical protein
MQKLLPASLALAMALPGAARADASAEIGALRREIEAMRADYQARLQSLEQRLRAAESAAGSATAPPAAAAASVAPTAAPPAANASAVSADAVAAAPPPPPATPTSPSAGGGIAAFNPAISLILSGLYANTSKDPGNYAISGFPRGEDAEIGPGARGFSLAESELALSASIDPWLRGAINIALHPDDAVSVEEAYIQTTSLGAGFSIKAGRFFSNIGYLNPQHAHTWDFVDNPLAYQAMLGTQYGDDGVQLTWLAPTEQYLELGAELGRGRGFPGGDDGGNGAGMFALTAHTGGDVGASHSWRAGLSLLRTRSDGQALEGLRATDGADAPSAFSGHTRVWIADAVWKWAPGGNATRTSFKLQGEFLHATRSGDLAFDPEGLDRRGGYRAVQSGWYVQGVYQFMPRWRVGLRTERLDAGSPDYGLNADRYADGSHEPSKNSLMLDYSPSEFSRLRLQVARDRAREDATDHQIFLQYQTSLGAHGAHGY